MKYGRGLIPQAFVAMLAVVPATALAADASGKLSPEEIAERAKIFKERQGLKINADGTMSPSGDLCTKPGDEMCRVRALDTQPIQSPEAAQRVPIPGPKPAAPTPPR